MSLPERGVAARCWKIASNPIWSNSSGNLSENVQRAESNNNFPLNIYAHMLCVFASDHQSDFRFCAVPQFLLECARARRQTWAQVDADRVFLIARIRHQRQLMTAELE